MNRIEYLQYKINRESVKLAIRERNARNERDAREARQDARRFLADPEPPTGYADLIGLPETKEAA